MPVTSVGTTPDFAMFKDDKLRAAIVRLRSAVEPLLQNNLLPHFTDHSVAHSDSVVKLVDHLIAPLQESENCLSDQELLVVYAACYLHDLGMQYEPAGNTAVIKGLNLGLRWEEIGEQERRDLLRRYHHLISAELVAGSVHSSKPPIGLQLDDGYRPAEIASLCEAHCISPTNARYQELMRGAPALRMPLLSGVLRLGDILDESRHRACRPRAGTLMLNGESQAHWWRHYYTQDVRFEDDRQIICVCFEFPRGRADEYERVIPELQLPWIQAELDYHRNAFGAVGLSWRLDRRTTINPYSSVEVMPDAVLTEMLKQLQRNRVRIQENTHRIALQTFNEARPLIERRLLELRAQHAALKPDDYLDQLVGLADDLWDIGSFRSACIAVAFEFSRLYASLSPLCRVRIGCRLLEMLIDDDAPDLAKGWVKQFAADLESLSKNDPVRFKGTRLLALWYDQACGYPEATDMYNLAINLATTIGDRETLTADLIDMHFLQGEIDQVTSSVPKSA